jgi:nuclear transport factor 2 (NTF2) superfamily protein
MEHPAMPSTNHAPTVEPADLQLLRRAYAGFNARDIASTLATMRPDVAWPNGMEGGYVHGHDAVRAYWTRQWTMIDPHVEPVVFTQDDEGRIRVDVHQLVRDLSGTVLMDQKVTHRYTLREGLIVTMEILPPAGN